MDEKEIMVITGKIVSAIQWAGRTAEQIGEDAGYLAPPMWIQARVWVQNNLIPTEHAYNHDHTSYGLKHMMEDDIHIYMTNSQFKMLMIECGYLPKDPSSKNWIFKIKDTSPALKKWRNE